MGIRNVYATRKISNSIYHVDLECQFDICIVENTSCVNQNIDGLKISVDSIEFFAQICLVGDVNLEIRNFRQRIFIQQSIQLLIRSGLNIDNRQILNSKRETKLFFTCKMRKKKKNLL